MKKIAVIGAGYWGKNLIRNYNQLGVLKTICDFNSTTVDKMKGLYPSVKTTMNYDDVLNDSEISGVVIALPAEFHFEFAEKALNTKKDVFVEKPLALDINHAEKLIEIAGKNNCILMVGHLLRYHPAFIKLKELAEKGELGRIQYIYSNRLSLGKIRREENTLWSFAPHDISMILALCNEMPDEVMATGANYLHKTIADVTTTHLTFPSGIKSHIFVSWLHPYKEQKLVVVADKKMAVFEDTQNWNMKIQLYPHSIKWEKGIPNPEESLSENIAVIESEPLHNECKHFIECIEKRNAPVTDGHEGLKVLKVLNLAQKSLESQNQLFTKPENINQNKQNYYKHESAYVDEPSEIGEGTKIWHFSHVLKGVQIGKNCIIGQNVQIADDVVLGNNVKIQNNVSVYKGVTVEDDVFLGPSCVFTNVTNPRSQVNRHSLYEKTLIKRGATIGANSTILCGTIIGRYALIGAGAVVTKDVPDYALVSGVPSRQTGWVSRHGVKLSKPDKKGIMVCPESKLRYKFDNNKILKCVDLDEEAQLPEKMAVGRKHYDEFKKTTSKLK